MNGRIAENVIIKIFVMNGVIKMGMSIDEIIQGIEIIKAQAEWEYPLDWQIVLDDAIEIMRKYQKIEQIVVHYRENVRDKVINENMEKILGEVEDGRN